MKRSNVKKARMEQSRRPKKNPLKAAGIEKVDYKDINTLVCSSLIATRSVLAASLV